MGSWGTIISTTGSWWSLGGDSEGKAPQKWKMLDFLLLEDK